jgi:membrane-associated PAP2 superfamily phosphatase
MNNWVQDFFYNPELKEWMIDRNNKILDLILYSGIKKLFIVIILFLIFALIFMRKKKWVGDNKRGLSIVVASCLIIPLTVGALKATTNMPCPNQLNEYGGKYNDIGLFETLPLDNSRASTRCYPAGHASGGFALLSLLFLFNTRRAKVITLTSVMIFGWTTANYKMLIGDHFIGHTIITMLLAWWLILIITKTIDKGYTKYINNV